MSILTQILPAGLPKVSDILTILTLNAAVYVMTYGVGWLRYRISMTNRNNNDNEGPHKKAIILARSGIIFHQLWWFSVWLADSTRYQRGWEGLLRCHYDAAVRSVAYEIAVLIVVTVVG